MGVCEEMKKDSVLPFQGVHLSVKASEISAAFLPPSMSSIESKSKNQVVDESNCQEVAGMSSPSKRRRQDSVTDVSNSIAVVEPVAASTESSPVPSRSASSDTMLHIDDDTNDRTSKDYYFDSYSHHSIRKFKVSLLLPPTPQPFFASANTICTISNQFLVAPLVDEEMLKDDVRTSTYEMAIKQNGHVFKDKVSRFCVA